MGVGAALGGFGGASPARKVEPTKLKPVVVLLGSVAMGLSVAKRLRVTLTLIDAGFEMMRLSLKRRYPRATAAELQRKFRRWATTRPGAEAGDAVGRSVDPAVRFP